MAHIETVIFIPSIIYTSLLFIRKDVYIDIKRNKQQYVFIIGSCVNTDILITRLIEFIISILLYCKKYLRIEIISTILHFISNFH